MNIETLIQEIRELRKKRKSAESQMERNRIDDQILEKKRQVTQLMHLIRSGKIC